MIELTDRITITGGAGFLGRHIVEELRQRGYENVFVPRSVDFDLRREGDVKYLFASEEPDIVIHAAAHAGGIGLNQEKPGELFFDNAIMGILMMEEARKWDVKKYVQIGTVCEYPKWSPVPFEEEHIWNGYPEETNAPYGIAKKALLVQGQAYRKQYGMNVIHLLPVNLYGPHDNFDTQSSHVIPAIIRKLVEAKNNDEPFVTLWGTGKASREFLHVEDAARGIVSALEKYDGEEPINLGSGVEVTIQRLAEIIALVVGYKGTINFDSSFTNGQFRRCLDIRKAQKLFDFYAQTNLVDGLQKTIDWYLKENS